MDPHMLFSGGGSSNLAYNLEITAKRYNLTGKNLDLKYFSSLRTPKRKDNDCRLEINFLGGTYRDYFNVTDAPIPKININSEFSTKDVPITFDGSLSEDGVVSWRWDFGDNTTSSGRIVQHSYRSEGNYTVTLTVKDSKDVESSTSVIIKIINLEEFLGREVTNNINELNKSISNFDHLKGELKDFYEDMGFDSIVLNSYRNLKKIESNFTSVRGSSISKTRKDTKYLELFNQFRNIIENTPKEIIGLDSLFHINYTPTRLYDVPTFSRIASLSDLNGIKNKIYLFNQRNVKGDYKYYLIRVDYLSGFDNYVYVDKQFRSSEGGELVDNLGNYRDVRIFSSGCSVDNSSNIIYCSSVGSNFNLRYAGLSDNISLTSGFVVPQNVYEGAEILYKFECDSGNCNYSYCGDRKCSVFLDIGVNESDKSGQYYCPQDCGKKVPWKLYIILGVVLIIGIFWINFYRGPGNFFDISNAISYKLFNRKLFLIEKDKIILRNYVIRALREGFNEGEIRLALRKKGWTKKQLDFIFDNIKRKNI
jgi:PKD repeat protein